MSTPRRSNTGKWKPSAAKQPKKLGDQEAFNLPTADTSLPRARGGERKVAHNERTTSNDDNADTSSRARALALSAPGSAEICSPAAPLTPATQSGNGGSLSAVSALTGSTNGSSKKTKPPASRVIIEVDATAKMLNQCLRCPKCESNLSVSFPTRCVAAAVRLDCANKAHCAFSCLGQPVAADNVMAGEDGDNRSRNAGRAVSALHAPGFVASGDGGTEAGRPLGPLGLPNSTTVQGRSLGNIEKQLSCRLQKPGDDIVPENLGREVKNHLKDGVDDSGSKPHDLWSQRSLPREPWPETKGTADMGWNQEGTGRKRSSKSGHAFIVGEHTRDATAEALCSKGCGHCKSFCARNPVGVEPPPHECFVNHHGSSGAVEPPAALEMHKWLCSQQVALKCIAAGDDSSTKAKLKWNDEDCECSAGKKPTHISSKGAEVNRPASQDFGGTPRHVPQPTFVAGPSHRRKTLASELCALEALPKTDPAKDNPKKKRKRRTDKWNLGMSKVDCRRSSKNFAFMARTLARCKADEEKLRAGAAALEHHFDDHRFCGKWCPRKGKENNKDEFHRDKTKEPELCQKLKSIFARFITLEALEEPSHAMDTRASESFNSTVAWVAPKNKAHCGTHSLKSRISIAIGMTALGTLELCKRLFNCLGIEVTPDVHHHLQQKGAHRAKRIAKTKTKEHKRKMKKEELEKIKEETKEARKRRDGAPCEPGVGMSGGHKEDGGKKPAAKKSKPSEEGEEPACSKCGLPGHWRATNKACEHCAPRGSKSNDKIAATAEGAAPAAASTPTVVPTAGEAGNHGGLNLATARADAAAEATAAKENELNDQSGRDAAAEDDDAPLCFDDDTDDCERQMEVMAKEMDNVGGMPPEDDGSESDAFCSAASELSDTQFVYQ